MMGSMKSHLRPVRIALVTALRRRPGAVVRKQIRTCLAG